MSGSGSGSASTSASVLGSARGSHRCETGSAKKKQDKAASRRLCMWSMKHLGGIDLGHSNSADPGSCGRRYRVWGNGRKTGPVYLRATKCVVVGGYCEDWTGNECRSLRMLGSPSWEVIPHDPRDWNNVLTSGLRVGTAQQRQHITAHHIASRHRMVGTSRLMAVIHSFASNKGIT